MEKVKKIINGDIPTGPDSLHGGDGLPDWMQFSITVAMFVVFIINSMEKFIKNISLLIYFLVYPYHFSENNYLQYPAFLNYSIRYQLTP